MRKSSYPTRIKLSEVNERGEEFFYSKSSGELNESLKDIINERDYSARVSLKPVGNVYEITCDFQTSMGLICSRCGRPTEKPVEGSCQELLVVEDDRPRGSKNAPRSQEHSASESGPFCNYIPSQDFNIADFVHEQMASNEPYIVECGASDCEKVLDSLQGEPDFEKQSPFAVLKDLKL